MGNDFFTLLAGSKSYFVLVVGAVFAFAFYMNMAMQQDVSMIHTHRIESNWGRSSSLVVLQHSMIRHNCLGEWVMMEPMFCLVTLTNFFTLRNWNSTERVIMEQQSC